MWYEYEVGGGTIDGILKLSIDCPTFKSQFVPQLYIEMYVII